VAAEAALEGEAFGGGDAEGGDEEDAGEGFFSEDGVVLILRGLGLGVGGDGALAEGGSVGERGCGEVWDEESGCEGKSKRGFECVWEQEF